MRSPLIKSLATGGKTTRTPGLPVFVLVLLLFVVGVADPALNRPREREAASWNQPRTERHDLVPEAGSGSAVGLGKFISAEAWAPGARIVHLVDVDAGETAW